MTPSQEQRLSAFDGYDTAAEDYSANRDRANVEYPAERYVMVEDNGDWHRFRVDLTSEPVYTAVRVDAAGKRLRLTPYDRIG